MLLKKQGFQDAYVRPIAWRGSEQMGAGRTTESTAPSPSGNGRATDPAQKSGIRLDLAEWRRPDPRTAPSKSKACSI
jgi:branched-chain amino acid aminotransferase